MPLSEHEQRMLDQIESALYAEDPKFASSVRGGSLRAPSARRRLKGAGLVLAGLVMLIAGVAFSSQSQLVLIISVVGFVVMFAGAVVAVTSPRAADNGTDGPLPGGGQEDPQWRWFIHQPHGGQVPPQVRRIATTRDT